VTKLSVILSFFPTLVLVLIGAAFLYMCAEPGIISVVLFLFSLYGFPLLVYRVHKYFHPIKEGISYLQGKEYSPWWGSYQIQSIYNAIPILEAVLRLIPGAFSVWLRLWGARVGDGVYWTTEVEIGDRELLEIGDRVIFGHKIAIYPHVIKPKKDNLMLYVKKVKIGNDVFLGAGSRLAAGVAIKDGAYLPLMTDIYPNQTH
jgi:acetyltransferase-like isoleucine patch superfamily enzyme